MKIGWDDAVEWRYHKPFLGVKLYLHRSEWRLHFWYPFFWMPRVYIDRHGISGFCWGWGRLHRVAFVPIEERSCVQCGAQATGYGYPPAEIEGRWQMPPLCEPHLLANRI